MGTYDFLDWIPRDRIRFQTIPGEKKIKLNFKEIKMDTEKNILYPTEAQKQSSIEKWERFIKEATDFNIRASDYQQSCGFCEATRLDCSRCYLKVSRQLLLLPFCWNGHDSIYSEAIGAAKRQNYGDAAKHARELLDAIKSSPTVESIVAEEAREKKRANDAAIEKFLETKNLDDLTEGLVERLKHVALPKPRKSIGNCLYAETKTCMSYDCDCLLAGAKCDDVIDAYIKAIAARDAAPKYSVSKFIETLDQKWLTEEQIKALSKMSDDGGCPTGYFLCSGCPLSRENNGGNIASEKIRKAELRRRELIKIASKATLQFIPVNYGFEVELDLSAFHKRIEKLNGFRDVYTLKSDYDKVVKERDEVKNNLQEHTRAIFAILGHDLMAPDVCGGNISTTRKRIIERPDSLKSELAELKAREVKIQSHPTRNDGKFYTVVDSEIHGLETDNARMKRVIEAVHREVNAARGRRFIETGNADIARIDDILDMYSAKETK